MYTNNVFLQIILNSPQYFVCLAVWNDHISTAVILITLLIMSITAKNTDTTEVNRIKWLLDNILQTLLYQTVCMSEPIKLKSRYGLSFTVFPVKRTGMKRYNFYLLPKTLLCPECLIQETAFCNMISLIGSHSNINISQVKQ